MEENGVKVYSGVASRVERPLLLKGKASNGDMIIAFGNTATDSGDTDKETISVHTVKLENFAMGIFHNIAKRQLFCNN